MDQRRLFSAFGDVFVENEASVYSQASITTISPATTGGTFVGLAVTVVVLLVATDLIGRLDLTLTETPLAGGTGLLSIRTIALTASTSGAVITGASQLFTGVVGIFVNLAVTVVVFAITESFLEFVLSTSLTTIVGAGAGQPAFFSSADGGSSSADTFLVWTEASQVVVHGTVAIVVNAIAGFLN